MILDRFTQFGEVCGGFFFRESKTRTPPRHRSVRVALLFRGRSPDVLWCLQGRLCAISAAVGACPTPCTNFLFLLRAQECPAPVTSATYLHAVACASASATAFPISSLPQGFEINVAPRACAGDLTSLLIPLFSITGSFANPAS